MHVKQLNQVQMERAGKTELNNLAADVLPLNYQGVGLLRANDKVQTFLLQVEESLRVKVECIGSLSNTASRIGAGERNFSERNRGIVHACCQPATKKECCSCTF